MPLEAESFDSLFFNQLIVGAPFYDSRFWNIQKILLSKDHCIRTCRIVLLQIINIFILFVGSHGTFCRR